MDTVRYTWLLKLNINNNNPTLFCGPTGTGKTCYIKDLLSNGLPKDVFNMVIDVGFSA
jgi:dynein heavy chain, axonemal